MSPTPHTATPAERAFLDAQGQPWDCLTYLGEGCRRRVYAIGDLPYVLKVLKNDSDTYANENEWAVWQRVSDTPAAQHLSRTYAISEDGRLLLAERVLCDTWGDTSRWEMEFALVAAGVRPYDTIGPNCGRRPGLARQSVFLDYECFEIINRASA